jgi:NAD(P)-dependent dehydrogenase (short-subunit alcohol dehydrogenase family)
MSGAMRARGTTRDRVADAYLRGRHAIVTGGGRGIGAAIASELARLGASVTLMGRDRGALQAHGQTLRNEIGARVQEVRCDVSDERSVQSAFVEAARGMGAPYVLVNNAGGGAATSVREMTRESWDQTLAVNLTGTFLCTREVIGAMLDARDGRIINIASTAGLKGYKRMAAYCAAKHGIVGFTRALAAEAATSGVTVNAVCPGYTADTDLTRQAVENLVAAGRAPNEAEAMLTRGNPQGRLVRPEEVANAVAWLCSADAGAVTGQTIIVAGGEIM